MNSTHKFRGMECKKERVDEEQRHQDGLLNDSFGILKIYILLQRMKNKGFEMEEVNSTNYLQPQNVENMYTLIFTFTFLFMMSYVILYIFFLLNQYLDNHGTL